ncbi:MAG: hypothetical protein JHC85_01830, partial [Chthoniobacterales bacterium]|nr:hypothetical protein [Chthoniobacterales bacterium]
MVQIALTTTKNDLFSRNQKMPYVLLSSLFLLLGYPMVGSAAAVWACALSQLILFVGEMRRGQVTGSGAFLFMSFLFFGMRPIYLVLESDYSLFHRIFLIRPDMELVTSAMWWASFAAVMFALGVQLQRKTQAAFWCKRLQRNRLRAVRPSVNTTMVAFLMTAQFVTLPLMYLLARSAGRTMYGGGMGAYAYDVPVPMQAIHIFAIVVLVERYLRRKSPGDLILLAVSSVAFLAFTWLMRDVSNFRGFYLTGVLVVGIAVLQRLKPRVSYVWLLLPILVAQPFF